jgi:hypothetical protein
MPEPTVKAKLAAKAEAQTFLSQLKILYPSRIPMGIKLKRAIQALKKAPRRNIPEYGLGTKAMANITVDRTMLTAGPEIDIFPILSRPAAPEIMTAPGEMTLNQSEITEMKVKTAPQSVSLNSAHNPRLCAVTLCAISCVKKDAVRIAVKAANVRAQSTCAKTFE